MKRLAILAGLTFLTLTGCGKSYCAKQMDSMTRVIGTCSLSWALTTEAKCEASIGTCTDDDLAVLDGYLTCLDNLAACTPGKELSYTLLIGACHDSAGTLSGACDAAL